MMKACLVLFLALSIRVFSECSCENLKTYVRPEQILFGVRDIYIDMNGQLVQTDAIHSDAEGLYIIADEEKRDCKSPDWWCVYCKQCNAYWYSRCPKCYHWR